MLNVSIISADFSRGQPKCGVEKGPTCILEGGHLVTHLSQYSEVTVMPSLNLQQLTASKEEKESSKRLLFPQLVSKATQRLYQAICEQRSQADVDVMLTLGGDHSIAIGSVAATCHFYPDVCVVWLDAHADINTPMTSPSGKMHGMPLAFLCNIDNCLDTIPELEWMTRVHSHKENEDQKQTTRETMACLSKSRLAYIGLRDVDIGEEAIIERDKLIAFTMKDVTSMGIQSVVQSMLNQLPAKAPIHLSIDIDALDPDYAPSTGTPVAGGLSLNDLLYVTKTMGETGRLVAMDLVEVNPDITSSPGKEDVMVTIASALATIQSTLQHTALSKKSFT
jgi:arginase